VKLGAVSVDHLETMDEDTINLLAASKPLAPCYPLQLSFKNAFSACTTID
jgi:imidazolonepropionase-like amidohydrolase